VIAVEEPDHVKLASADDDFGRRLADLGMVLQVDCVHALAEGSQAFDRILATQEIVTAIDASSDAPA
jgi:hypothetical protein